MITVELENFKNLLHTVIVRIGESQPSTYLLRPSLFLSLSAFSQLCRVFPVGLRLKKKEKNVLS